MVASHTDSGFTGLPNPSFTDYETAADKRLKRRPPTHNLKKVDVLPAIDHDNAKKKLLNIMHGSHAPAEIEPLPQDPRFKKRTLLDKLDAPR